MGRSPNSDFNLRKTASSLQIGQHGIGLPEDFFIPYQLIGSQAVDPRMSQHRPGNRDFLPRQSQNFIAGCIPRDVDTIMAADTVTFVLQVANPLKNPVVTFFLTRQSQPSGQFGQSILELFEKEVGCPSLFFLALGGITVQPRFGDRFVHYPLNKDGSP